MHDNSVHDTWTHDNSVRGASLSDELSGDDHSDVAQRLARQLREWHSQFPGEELTVTDHGVAVATIVPRSRA